MLTFLYMIVSFPHFLYFPYFLHVLLGFAFALMVVLLFPPFIILFWFLSFHSADPSLLTSLSQ